MDISHICMFILLSPVLGVPTLDRRAIFQRMASNPLTAKGGYGIEGGKPAKIEKYPYTASLVSPKTNYIIGGASILNKHWLVASAFEIFSYTPNEISIRIGSNKALSGGQELKVDKYIVHEKFDIDYPYDVAVLKTKEAIKLGKSAKPIKLAVSVAKAGTNVVVTGFGDKKNNTGGSLQVGSQDMLSQSDCVKTYTSCEKTCVCADSDTVGPCFSDLGDPLVKNKELVGWFLGGDFCNYYSIPDLYANAAELRQWVVDTIKKNSNEEEMEGIDDDDFYRSFDDDDDDD